MTEQLDRTGEDWGRRHELVSWRFTVVATTNSLGLNQNNKDWYNQPPQDAKVRKGKTCPDRSLRPSAAPLCGGALCTDVAWSDLERCVCMYRCRAVRPVLAFFASTAH